MKIEKIFQVVQGIALKDRAVAQPGLARYLGVVEVVGSNPAGPTVKSPSSPSAC